MQPRGGSGGGGGGGRRGDLENFSRPMRTNERRTEKGEPSSFWGGLANFFGQPAGPYSYSLVCMYVCMHDGGILRALLGHVPFSTRTRMDGMDGGRKM